MSTEMSLRLCSRAPRTCTKPSCSLGPSGAFRPLLPGRLRNAGELLLPGDRVAVRTNLRQSQRSRMICHKRARVQMRNRVGSARLTNASSMGVAPLALPSDPDPIRITRPQPLPRESRGLPSLARYHVLECEKVAHHLEPTFISVNACASSDHLTCSSLARPPTIPCVSSAGAMVLSKKLCGCLLTLFSC